jgi:DNA-binding transcriptional regulator YiaG
MYDGETTMTEHNDAMDNVCVLNGAHRQDKILAVYDATVHVGLRTMIYDAAIEHVIDGEEAIEVPKPRELRAAAAVARCLMPIKLRGREIKAMRKILKLTLGELAKWLDERTAAETVSRWESEAQPMGGYAERLLRLLVCEELSEEAQGIEYNAKMISNLRVEDPWKVNPEYEVPAIKLRLIELKESSGTIIETWNEGELRKRA